MFRIQKAFEDDRTIIFSVAGKITDDQIDVWSQEITGIAQKEKEHLILNFCSLAFISAKALKVLTDSLSRRVHIMNCSVYVRNLLHASGSTVIFLD